MSPKVALQYLLPHRLLSAGMRALMHWRWSPWKNAVIGAMTRLYAIDVAARLRAPDPVFVLDVCESDTGLHLLEINPFSGADLYGCDRAALVQAVHRYVS